MDPTTVLASQQYAVRPHITTKCVHAIGTTAILLLNSDYNAITFNVNRTEQRNSVQPLPSCATVSEKSPF